MEWLSLIPIASVNLRPHLVGSTYRRANNNTAGHQRFAAIRVFREFYESQWALYSASFINESS